MRVHLIGLPHTETTKAYSWCAFTEKTRKLARMLHSLGYDVRLYAGEANEAPCTEHIPIVDRAWQQSYFSQYDWARDTFNDFDASKPFWQEFNGRAIGAIRARMEPHDILALSMGWSQKPVADALPELMPVEVGIGYSGVWAPFRVYESYAWMHHLAGRYGYDDVRFYDQVIPNSFEPEDFPLGKGDGEYYLFIGRFIRRKGIQIAVEATEKLGMPLLMAGQGIVDKDEIHHRFRGIDIEVQSKELYHCGVVGPEERARLMGGAIAVFAPSLYLEPFCGVHVEARLCGTPVITTDWGVFTETVEHVVDGFRCSTLAEFVSAARSAPRLDRALIRERAMRYSVDTVRHEYDRYFRKLQTLYGQGWYTEEAPHAR